MADELQVMEIKEKLEKLEEGQADILKALKSILQAMTSDDQ